MRPVVFDSFGIHCPPGVDEDVAPSARAWQTSAHQLALRGGCNPLT